MYFAFLCALCVNPLKTMLDNETKRRIDTARDVLVGKVPDPKSQVEQITIALVYKFMDDMDKESIEMGGKPSFFTGDYEKYSWTKIFDPRLGGFEMLALYSDGITRMSLNPNLPQLFRNIFKNAFLPYRDPETLKLFLKTINEFHYDHSERLGDAFEYLLSVLGSQGDAGQFRTPRHIIDFIVSVIQPKKNETILDPACGTAGFLISAFKHILKENTKKTPGDLLTPDDRKRLLANFKGYDISPDMVRLSLVNLYLHGFVQPQIFEYDTLTSEDRWNEYADVILANPPFMSPKGGIKPHKRFSVQSNRSEVLFVDYMAEHLTPTGRAGIIVPEGIIFQSANAYKHLRKYLVENEYLWAVVSLPAGIFNPYSGVKTSILLMDKAIAKKTDKILFVKIENDGFDLGAQRRPIEKNDLPDAANVITDWLKAVRNGKPEAFNIEEKPCGALLIEKTKLAENGDYNLTGERYRQAEVRIHQKWPMVEIGEVCEINPETGIPTELFGESNFVYIDISSVENSTGKVSFDNVMLAEEAPSRARRILRDKDLLVSTVRPNLKAFGIIKNPPEKIMASTGFAVLRPKAQILPEYLFDILFDNRIVGQMVKRMGKGSYPSINQADIEVLTIPLPPLEVQREIVAEIEGYQKVIDGARQVVENWKPNIDYYLRELRALCVKQKMSHTESTENTEEWPMVKLGEIASLEYGYTASASDRGTARFIRITDITDKGTLKQEDAKYIETTEENSNYLLKKGDILVARTGATYGKTLLFNQNIPAIFASYLIRIRFHNNTVIPEYYWIFSQFEMYWNQAKNLVSGGGQPQFNGNALKQIQIPLPPLEVQREIVAAIESEQKLVDGNRELVRVYEEKIKKVIDCVWEG